MLLSAKIDVGNADVAVILRNLSSEGALIEGPELPPEGSVTVFRRNELRVNGRIVWVLASSRPDLIEVERQYRRPGLACRPLSEADRKMVQMWMTPDALRTK